MARFIIILGWILFSTTFLHADDTLTAQQREALKTLFKGEFADDVLHSFFHDKRLAMIADVVPKNVFNKQYKRNYESFHNAYSTRRAQKFMRYWRTRLAQAEKKYGVDKEAIVAILLVETGLGSIKGRYHVPSVYASIVLGSVEQLEASTTAKELQEYEGLDYREKLQRKIEWSKDELRALLHLKIAGREVMDLVGSSSGAFGLCQFIPSSLRSWGIDGDQDGRINLYSEADAIPSVANYLKSHGWKKGIRSPENQKAVFAYNRSQIYVDTILDVAERLQGKVIKK